MRRSGEVAGKGKEGGIGPPVLWSAAGHLLLLLAILSLPPGGPARSLPGVVEVLLVSASESPAGGMPSASMPVRLGKASGAGEGTSRIRTLNPVVPPPTVADGPEVGASPPAPEHAAVQSAGPAEAAPIREPAAPAPATVDPFLSALAARSAAEQGTPQAAGSAGTAIGGSGSATVGGQTVETAPKDAGRPLAVLRARIRERIVYPAEAVRRGEEGEVLLLVRVGIGGVPREIQVANSSGSRILDEAARRGVVRAAPLPSDPGWFEIPVRFSLR